MSIRFKLSFLMLVLFLAAIFNSIFSFWLEGYSEEKLKWVIHTHEVLHTTEKLLGSIKDAETGQRGYLLTNQSSYLEPYHQGLIAAKENFNKLQQLTSDNPDQQETLQHVEKEMKLKIEELKETIDLAQDGNISKALEIVALGKGKQEMEHFREELALLNSAELILLEHRKGDLRVSRARITTLITVEIVFLIGLAIMTLMFLQKSLFQPLKLLVSSAKKVELGGKLSVIDVLEKNEMGHLLSTFLTMSKKVYNREKELDHKASHDELTGLNNRTNLNKDLDASINEAQQSGSKVATLFIDLNLFKQINDNLGHDVGDFILKETAARIEKSLRVRDTAFRFGGDEFLVILRDIKNNDDIHHIIEKMLTTFEQPADFKGKPITISLSIGVAVSPDDTSDCIEMLKLSDIAMYAAKQDENTSYKIFNQVMLKRASDHK